MLNLSSEQRLRKSVRYAKLLINCTILLLFVLVAWVSGYAFFEQDAFARELQASYNVQHISRYRLWLYVVYFQVGILPFVIAAWSLRRVFVAFEQPVIQLDNVVTLANRTAICLWIAIALSIFGETISHLILYPQTDARYVFDIDIGLTDILAILAAIMASVMAHALRLGIEIWQENKEII